MIFKNAAVMKVSNVWLTTLHEKLQNLQFSPCGSQDLQRVGFKQVFGEWCYMVGDKAVICVQQEEKVLPSAVVNLELQKRIEAKGYRLGGKEKRELKEQVITEMLPKAFVKQSETWAFIYQKNGYLVVNTSSPKKAGLVTSCLINCDSGIEFDLMPDMTGFMSMAIQDCTINGFSVDDSIKIASESADIIFKGLQVSEEDTVKAYCEDGMTPLSIALTHDDKMSFTLTDNFMLKRLEFHGIKPEKSKAQDVFNSQFLLMSEQIVSTVMALEGK